MDAYAPILFLQQFANPVLTAFFQYVTLLGQSEFWVFLAAILFWQGHEEDSFYVMSILLFSAVAVAIFKTTFHELRPNEQIVQKFTHASGYSLPSGHSTLASAEATWISTLKNKKWTVLAIIGALLVMISRMYLGVHYLHDVVAGALLGITLTAGLWFLLKKAKYKFFGYWNINKKAILYIGIIILLILLIAKLEIKTIWFGGIMLGYFLGLVLLNSKMVNIDSKTNIWMQLGGIIGLFAVYSCVYLFLQINKIVALVIAIFGGFWISVIYPALLKLSQLAKDLKNKSVY